jgi:hypothetical protein
MGEGLVPVPRTRCFLNTVLTREEETGKSTRNTHCSVPSIEHCQPWFQGQRTEGLPLTQYQDIDSVWKILSSSDYEGWEVRVSSTRNPDDYWGLRNPHRDPDDHGGLRIPD